MSKIEVNEIVPQSGTTLTLGGSGDTLSIASGVSSSFPSLTVSGDLTVDTNTLYVDSANNRVGVGTSSPAYNLDVLGQTGSLTRLRVQNTGTIASDSSVLQLGIAGTTAESLIYFGDSDDNNAGQLRYDHASDYLSIHTAGSEVMRITSAGNVGIGTTSPDRPLDIETNVPAVRLTDTTLAGVYHEILGDGNSLSIEADDGNVGSNSSINFKVDGTEQMRIDSSGNVGIGTSSPNAKLHIHGPDQTTANIDTSSNIVLNVAGTGSSPNNGGSVVFSANDGAWRFAAIKGLVTNGSNNTIGDLAFSVRNLNTDSTLSEAMRIKSDGNVGIGTSSPSTILHLSNTVPIIRLEDTDTGAYSDISANSSVGSLFIKADEGNTVANTVLGFFVDNAEAMRINSSGNVGINVSNPTSKLSVVSGTSVGSNDVISVAPENGALGRESRILFGATFSSGWSGADYTVRLTGGIGYGSTGGSDPRDLALKFYTTNKATGTDTPTERMRIDSSGNVGIGTNSPSGILHLDMGTPDIVAELTANSPTFTYRNGTGAWFHAGKHPTNDYFYIGDGATTTTNITMVIDSSGNVGIGTNSPSKTLDIDGQLRIRNGGATGYGLLEYGASATATNNWHVGSEGDGSFRFYNGNFGSGTERMRIDSSGNVGIGESSPSQALDVVGNIKSSQSITIGSNGLYEAGSIYSDSNWGMIFRAKQASPAVADFRWANSADTERMRIDTSGHVIIPNGVTLGTTAGTYNAANTLDDYEEGTFTITLTGATTAPTTPITAIGHYTKIGQVVHIIHSFPNVNTTGASGTLNITGLPFTSRNTSELRTVGTIWGNCIRDAGVDITNHIASTLNQNSTTMTAVHMYDLTAVDIYARTAAYLYVSITYFTDS